jgi:hypothetical protein
MAIEEPEMSKPTEVFENEEASRLLDYFVAYKKLMSKVEYLKCISALNHEIHFQESLPVRETPYLAKEVTESPVSYSIALEK